MKLVELLGTQPIRYLNPEEILFVGSRETHDISRHMQSQVEDQTKITLTELQLPRAQKMLANVEEIRLIELPGYRDHRRLPEPEERGLVTTEVRSLDGQ